MQKFTKFLENYVQWVALALGIAWIGWVGYAYWASPPVSIEVNGQRFGPGDLDEYIAKPGNAIDTINKGLANNLPIPKVVLKELDPANAPKYALEFTTSMSLASLDAAPMRSWTPSVDFDPLKRPENIEAGIEKAPLPTPGPDTVTSIGVQAGASFLKYPDKNAIAKPDDPGATLVDPNDVEAKPVLMVPRELNWITASFKLNIKPLAESFKKIPADVAMTQVLNVRLMRQELLPNGTWAPETPVPDPANQFRLPWPPKSGDEELIYTDWAAKHTLDLIQPPFYEVQAGTPWHTVNQPESVDPNKPNANRPAVKEGAFNPVKEKDLQDYEIWAHDETTVPGHIYRYKIVVYLKNPLYQTERLARNASDEKTLWLAVNSDWSKPVKSPSRQLFFVVNGGAAIGANPKVAVEYLSWEKGEWKSKTSTLQPGDAVGGTKWTVVDLRPYVGGEYRILFINEDGEIVSRFYKNDMKDETYLKIKSQIKSATPPAGAAAVP